MAEVEAFLAESMPRLAAAEKEFTSGNDGPRTAMWSHNDPVTLFGANATASGWTEISATFRWLASLFSNCTSWEYQVSAAGASGDLAYIVGIERQTLSVGGAAPQSQSLRVTTIFRREESEWKVVHRHADPMPDSASTLDHVDRVNRARPPR